MELLFSAKGFGDLVSELVLCKESACNKHIYRLCRGQIWFQRGSVRVQIITLSFLVSTMAPRKSVRFADDMRNQKPLNKFFGGKIKVESSEDPPEKMFSGSMPKPAIKRREEQPEEKTSVLNRPPSDSFHSEQAPNSFAQSSTGGTDEQRAAPDDVERDELEKHFSEGNLGLRSKWGVRVARSDSGGLSNKYTGTRSEKAQYRLDWIKTELAKRTRTKSKTETFKQRGEKKEQWLSFGQMLEKRGGWNNPYAQRAAENYVKSCENKGKEWIGYDADTDEVTYFYYEDTKIDLFDKAWELKETWDDSGVDVAANTQNGGQKKTAVTAKPSTASGASKDDPEPQEDPKKTPKGRSDPKQNEKDLDPSKPEPKEPKEKPDRKKPKTMLDEILARASNTKKEMATISVQARSLLAQMEEDTEMWGWANSKKLHEATSKLDPDTDFGKNFMCLSPKELNMQYKDSMASLEVELPKFQCDMSKRVQSARTIIQRLLGGQACGRSSQRNS